MSASREAARVAEFRLRHVSHAVEFSILLKEPADSIRENR